MPGNHRVVVAEQEMTYFMVNMQILHVSAVFKPGPCLRKLNEWLQILVNCLAGVEALECLQIELKRGAVHTAAYQAHCNI